jgi:hypothetical protein
MLLAVAFSGGALLLVAWIVVCQPVWSARAGITPVAPDLEDALRRHVQVLAGTFALREARHADVLDAAADYVHSAFVAAGGHVESEPFEVDGQLFRNVVAAFGPSAGPRVVVGAHYDAPSGSPGADDNASGVAGLLELARLLGRERLTSGVHLVAFALEEQPYFGTASMGSAVHARRLAREGTPVRAMLSLEMIGYFDARQHSQHYPTALMRAAYPSRGNFVLLVGRWADWRVLRVLTRAMRDATPLAVRAMCLPSWVPEIDRSDHSAFWQAGYSGVMITDTAYYRNAAYHSEADTPDTLEYSAMARVVVGVHAGVRALCNAPIGASLGTRSPRAWERRGPGAEFDAGDVRHAARSDGPAPRPGLGRV